MLRNLATHSSNILVHFFSLSASTKEMPPKGKGKSKGKGNDARKSFTSSPEKKTEPSRSPRKPKPIPADSTAESSSKSPNKRKKNTKDTATSRVSENQPIIDPFHGLLNPSPSHNEYLEDAMFLRKPRIEEPEIPDVPLLPPGYEEPPRSFGGLEEIVELAKRLNRRKD